MQNTSKIDAMVEACLKAHDLVKAHSTPEMQATMRILLLQIGQEIAREEAQNGKKRNVG
jgi:hypothetical protein